MEVKYLRSTDTDYSKAFFARCSAQTLYIMCDTSIIHTNIECAPGV